MDINTEGANVQRRNFGLGGTDIACVIGVNPWKSAMDLYLEKVGITESQPDNDAMWFGREMEPVLAKRYYKETGRHLYLPDQFDNPLIHHYFDWYLGSPDALYNANLIKDTDKPSTAEGGVDFKTTGRRSDYGEPGSDDVPPWVACQAHWYLGLTGAEWWDIAVLFFAPRREFHIYRLTRNQEIIDNLTEAGREFWHDHVLIKIPPPLDASEGTKRLLAHLYPRDVEDVFAANEEMERLAKLLKTLEEARDQAVEDLATVQNLIKQDIGAHAGVVTSIGRVTWKLSKSRKDVDFKAAFYALANYMLGQDPQTIDLDTIIEDCTTTRPGSRRFVTKWNKSEEEA